MDSQPVTGLSTYHNLRFIVEGEAEVAKKNRLVIMIVFGIVPLADSQFHCPRLATAQSCYG